MRLKNRKLVGAGAALALLGGGLMSSAGAVSAESPARAEAPATPSVQGGSLAGTSWELSAVMADGEVNSDLPAESTLTFGEDGELFVEPGCNVGGGTAQVLGQVLIVRDLTTTLMACSPPIMDLELQVLSTLRGVSFFQETGDQLVLWHPEHVLVYEAA